MWILWIFLGFTIGFFAAALVASNKIQPKAVFCKKCLFCIDGKCLNPKSSYYHWDVRTCQWCDKGKIANPVI